MTDITALLASANLISQAGRFFSNGGGNAALVGR